MVSYTESMTDWSYHGQILVLTYPLIGNYGQGPQRARTDAALRVEKQDLKVGEICEEPSHWRIKLMLSVWMRKHRVPGISGVDARALTKKIRENGTVLDKIVLSSAVGITFSNQNLQNLVTEVSLFQANHLQPVRQSADLCHRLRSQA